MLTVQQRAARLWQRLAGMSSGQGYNPTRRTVASAGAAAGEPLQPDACYVQVQVSELYLSYQRGWLHTFDPLLLLLVECQYGSRRVTLPLVRGLARLSRQMRKTAGGLVVVEPCASEWYPYRGEALAVAVVLCRVRRATHTRSLVALSEEAAAGGGAGAGLALHGLEMLLDAGALRPLLGARTVFDPASSTLVAPQSWALLDVPEQQPFEGPLREHRGRLLCGAAPYRRADYILCHLGQSRERADLAALPFFWLYEEARHAAALPGERHWQQAQASLTAFFVHLARSPDVTPAQASRIRAACLAELHKYRTATAPADRAARGTISRHA
jgi:hypothetical protein